MSPSNLRWFKSSRSSDSFNCVEVAFDGTGGGNVHMRDSKQGKASPVLTFAVAEFGAFVAGIMAGDFDRTVAS